MYTAAFMTLLIMCIGIIGNSLTILVILKSPRIRNVASTFIIRYYMKINNYQLILYEFSY